MKKLLLTLGTLVLACVTPFSQTGETTDERDTGVSLVVPQIVSISDTELLFPAYKGIGKIDLSTMKTSKIVSFEGETRLASGKGTGMSSLWDWCVFVVHDFQKERALVYYKNNYYWYQYKARVMAALSESDVDSAGTYVSLSSDYRNGDWIYRLRNLDADVIGDFPSYLIPTKYDGVPVVFSGKPPFSPMKVRMRYAVLAPGTFLACFTTQDPLGMGPRIKAYYYRVAYKDGILLFGDVVFKDDEPYAEVGIAVRGNDERFWNPSWHASDDEPRTYAPFGAIYNPLQAHQYGADLIFEANMRQVEKKDFKLAPEYLVDMILLETGGAARKLMDSCYMIGLWHYTALCGDTLYYFRKAPDGRARLYSKNVK